MKLVKGIVLFFLLIAVFLTACSNDSGQDTSSYDPADFEFSLPNTAGELVSTAPNEKTLYLYFTGVG
ncbi:MAG: hypothetical protein LRY73_17895 [Bacillus sp. (in: Bacteria)]|nr:hypothetical protein [Bacillus sp. (in: firmicutes)]